MGMTHESQNWSKRETGHLTGGTLAPAATDPEFLRWEQEDLRVFSWITTRMHLVYQRNLATDLFLVAILQPILNSVAKLQPILNSVAELQRNFDC